MEQFANKLLEDIMEAIDVHKIAPKQKHKSAF